MSKNIIEYTPSDSQSEYMGYVMVDKILHLSKDGDNTLINLINGDTLKSKDSMKTLSARILLSNDDS